MFPPRTRLGLLAAAACLLLAAGCAHGPSPASRTPALARFEFTRPQMGVPFRIVVYAPHETAASNATEAAFGRVAALNAILSDYDPDSEISRLCRDTPAGQPVRVSPELAWMLERSLALSRATDGAFDVTVGPLANLWRRARRQGQLPSESLLQEARARTGWRHLDFDARSRTVTLRVPGMRLDFGAIAKGYAADEALRVLTGHGCPRALVAAAGDVRAGEAPPEAPGWKVELGATDATNSPPARVLFLRHAAVATSGDLFQRLEIGGRRYSHILDPRTGIGLTDHSLVSVIARDGTTADSLATAVSVLGPDRGLALVEKTRGAAALILRAPGAGLETYESRRLRSWLATDPTSRP